MWKKGGLLSIAVKPGLVRCVGGPEEELGGLSPPVIQALLRNQHTALQLVQLLYNYA